MTPERTTLHQGCKNRWSEVGYEDNSTYTPASTVTNDHSSYTDSSKEVKNVISLTTDGLTEVFLRNS
ncbi:uncharacterized protein H6S33_004196 [Morchella sextelata]|uniref:uncharacterized protein n=1 Tax=Morchella sextelata TaxID=1174677 RepID=UPI001D036315|nr:uncharacterized protein H6S33_004196 [Morchella sextelata]KAH0605739.1 hypothetical protein H6S33_004196 [Morchella sextelata]